MTKAADPPAALRLPQEIIDIIIDHCHSDKGALSVLGLVSWSWLHSARRHLFARVELRELYCDPIVREPADQAFGPFWRVDFGLQIITRSPAIASCIRFVQIRAEAEEFIAPGFRFLSHLPNLRALSLIDIFWPLLKPKHVPTILKGIATVAPALEELSLTFVTFVNTADLAVFVRAFPKVKRVSFSSCSWHDHSSTPSVFRELPNLPVQTLICLERVTIHNYPPSPQPILELLLQRDAFKLDLKGVNIFWETDLDCLANFSMYEKFFNVVGTNLQTLELDVRVLDHHKPMVAIIQLLFKCRQLSSFSINICYRQRSTPVKWFEAILETVTASSAASLKEFIIHCDLRVDIERNKCIPWHKVDDVLSNAMRLPVFIKFELVDCYIDMKDGPWLDSSIREAVYGRLKELTPRLLQTGVLRIREHEK
ncbi:hypothetical protein BDZ89DRAFT_1067501 [Hymenopellis radicata]|nr:hypothetical protein BDZ89DRAFT_1067501 [Hymenopellis radicata]